VIETATLFMTLDEDGCPVALLQQNCWLSPTTDARICSKISHLRSPPTAVVCTLVCDRKHYSSAFSHDESIR